MRKALRGMGLVPVLAMLVVGLTACGGSNSLSGSAFSDQNGAVYVRSTDGTRQVVLRQVNELPPPPNTSGGLDQLISGFAHALVGVVARLEFFGGACTAGRCAVLMHASVLRL